MNSWKWSKGEAYYKSARLEKKNHTEEYDSQTNAINQSLADYSEDNPFGDSRREDLDIKMSDRELMVQRGINPFLQTSYVNDIVTRDMYLKPVNTTQGRTKVTSET